MDGRQPFTSLFVLINVKEFGFSCAVFNHAPDDLIQIPEDNLTEVLPPDA